MGTVTNLQTVREGGNGMDLAAKPTKASGSRVGEDNSRHVAVGVLVLAGVAIAAGLINVKLSAGAGRS